MLSSPMLIASILPTWLWPLVQVLIGLGVVIIVHEFGHFLVAKLAGIKVERFAVGFGPRVLGMKLGETDYCLKLLPLGGYVKMLGQEDVRPLDSDEKPDPRSYNAKPVSVRLAVVSAGVVMNIILAAALFVIVVMHGKKFVAPVVGGVRRHYPAATAVIRWTKTPGAPAAASRPITTLGLEPGDRIADIEGPGLISRVLGHTVTRFDHVALLAMLARADERFNVTVQRDVDGNAWVGTTRMGVRMGPAETGGGQRLAFGIMPAPDAIVETAPRGTVVPAPNNEVFRDDDRVVAVDGAPIAHGWQVEPVVERLNGPTAAVTVVRDGNQTVLTAPLFLADAPHVVYLADGEKLDARNYTIDKDGDEYVFTSLVRPETRRYKAADVRFASSALILDLLGMVPRIQVASVLAGTEAARKGLRPGDVIVSYGDRLAPTMEELRKIQNASAGREVQLVIERDGQVLPPIGVVPEKQKGGAKLGFVAGAYLASPVVAAVREGSWAQKAGIDRGCVVETVNGRAVKSWWDVYAALKAAGGKGVAVVFRRGSGESVAPVTANLEHLTAAQFDPDDYRVSLFAPEAASLGFEMVLVQEKSIPAALGWGLRETGGLILSTYATLRGLLFQTVSGKDVMGPLGMGKIGIEVAERSFMSLIYFMAFISATIAVLNFLPFPVVDGGHAVFLIIEKIRGRPVPVKVMNAIQIAGLVLLLLVFVLVTYQDVLRFF